MFESQIFWVISNHVPQQDGTFRGLQMTIKIETVFIKLNEIKVFEVLNKSRLIVVKVFLGLQ